MLLGFGVFSFCQIFEDFCPYIKDGNIKNIKNIFSVKHPFLSRMSCSSPSASCKQVCVCSRASACSPRGPVFTEKRKPL